MSGSKAPFRAERYDVTVHPNGRDTAAWQSEAGNYVFATEHECEVALLNDTTTELLEALEFYRRWNVSEIDNDCGEVARAALAQARGEEVQP